VFSEKLKIEKSKILKLKISKIKILNWKFLNWKPEKLKKFEEWSICTDD